jgi:hypothetical protein
MIFAHLFKSNYYLFSLFIKEKWTLMPGGVLGFWGYGVSFAAGINAIVVNGCSDIVPQLN